MDKQYCIFDMDGTLVDSMGYWERLGVEYLTREGVSQERAERAFDEISAMTLPQAVDYLIRTLRLTQTPEEIRNGMQQVMEGHYRHDVELKPGIRAYLEQLKGRGCRMCVATATAEPLARLCLERLGIAPYFQFILSCETVGIGKGDAEIYRMAARQLGGAPEETAVFEDALYAARTAKQAGFYTVGVKDAGQRCEWDQLSVLADETVTDWHSCR